MKKLLPTSCPKSARKSKRKRKPLPKPTKRIRPNAKRQRRLFKQNFGGKDYRNYIASLPCDICGVVGFSDPAHLTARGAGGKANVLAPLCHYRVIDRSGPLTTFALGCHERYDDYDPEIRQYESRLRENAAKRYADFNAQRKTA